MNLNIHIDSLTEQLTSMSVQGGHYNKDQNEGTTSS